MPPDIVEIVITAIGEYLDPWLDIVITATGEWLDPFVDIVLTATPSLGGLSPLMVLSGFALVLVGGWNLMSERR